MSTGPAISSFHRQHQRPTPEPAVRVIVESPRRGGRTTVARYVHDGLLMMGFNSTRPNMDFFERFVGSVPGQYRLRPDDRLIAVEERLVDESEAEPTATPCCVDANAGDDGPRVEIDRINDPGRGGGYGTYRIRTGQEADSFLFFQAQPGGHGVTNESLLAVVIDRLRCFQAGEFACEENAAAMRMIETGLQHLHQRTRYRKSRGVEGMYAK